MKWKHNLNFRSFKMVMRVALLSIIVYSANTLTVNSSEQGLLPIVQIIQKEYLNSHSNCDIFAFEHFEELKEFVNHKKISSGSCNVNFQNVFQYYTPCLVSIVDWMKSDDEDMQQLIKVAQKVRKSALLILNCDDACMNVVPVNIEKATFFL